MPKTTPLIPTELVLRELDTLAGHPLYRGARHELGLAKLRSRMLGARMNARLNQKFC
jgi:hypothetical protein